MNSKAARILSFPDFEVCSQSEVNVMMSDVDDNIDDVDWEDADDDGNSDNDESKLSVSVEPAIELTIPTAVNSEARNKKPATKKVVFTTDDYDSSLEKHKISLLSAVTDSVDCASACFSKELCGVLLPLLPLSLTTIGTFIMCKEHIIEVTRWFKGTFTMLPVTSVTAEEGRDGTNPQNLLEFVVRNRTGTHHQLCQIYCAILHGLNYSVRYMRTIDGVSFMPSDHPDLYMQRWNDVNRESTTKGTRADGKKLKERKAPVLPSLHSWVEVRLGEAQPMKARSGLVAVGSAAGKHASSSSGPAGVVDLTGDEDDDEVQILPSSSRSLTSSITTPATSSTVSSTRWIPVDLLLTRWDKPQCVEEEVRKGRPVQYVLGFDYVHMNTHSHSVSDTLCDARKQLHRGSSSCSAARGRMQSIDLSQSDDEDGTPHPLPEAEAAVVTMVNLTDKYKHRYQYATGREKDIQVQVEAWMDELIQRTNLAVLCGDCSSDAPLGVDMVHIHRNSYSTDGTGKRRKHSHPSVSHLEGLAKEELTRRHPLPGRIGDFKDHPVYFLERHLLSEQALLPSARAVAVFRGESVYLQTHKDTLRTKLQWRRLLKQVRREEEPVKLVQRKIISHSREEYEEEQQSTIELRLFGSWQTEPIQIPAVVDGVLPVNKHGNIEVWEGNRAFVPAGASYLDTPAALKSAQNLGLPCAPAVVGFERRGMYTVPVIEGAVVLAQHADIVWDASFFIAAVKEEAQYMKHSREVLGRWERLTYGIMSRQRLRETYGH